MGNDESPPSVVDENENELTADNFDTDEFYGCGPSPSETFYGNEEEIWFLPLQDRVSMLNANSNSNTTVTVEDWTEVPISSVGEDTSFYLDSSTLDTWDQAKEEISHLRTHLLSLLNTDNIESVNYTHLIDFALGPKSDFGLSNEQHKASNARDMA